MPHSSLDRVAGYARAWCQKEAERFKNETFIAKLRLVKMKHVELFTQYRFKATIGHLLEHWGVNTPDSTAWQHL